jgi:transposase
VSAALSSGEMRSSPKREGTVKRLQRKLGRQRKGSNHRARSKLQLARAQTREANRRKDWAEELSTDIARRYDLIRIENLKIPNMVKSARGTAESPGKNVAAKSGLNREISRSGWGFLGTRLEQKAPRRVERISPAYTSQRCSACGHVDKKSRKNQADFVCTACGYACNVDVNAARNIGAGHVLRGVKPAGPPARGDREARNLAA